MNVFPCLSAYSIFLMKIRGLCVLYFSDENTWALCTTLSLILCFLWNARGGEGYSGFHVTGMIGDFFFWFEIFDSGIF